MQRPLLCHLFKKSQIIFANIHLYFLTEPAVSYVIALLIV